MIYDNVIMRTIIELEERQVAALAEFCAREKISRAEAVRRAVDRLLESESCLQKDSAFGAWARRGDSRKLVDELRDEWAASDRP